MAYRDPRAFLLGLCGIALLRAYAEDDFDRADVEARLSDARALLDADLPPGEAPGAIGTVDGYRIWAPQYDAPNPLIDVEQPSVHDILSALPPGDAVDAACGTGRHARYLAARGHRVTAVDSSPAMLTHARTAVPEAAIHQGDLHALPLPDNSADVVVCALALAHVRALPAVFAEFARILRPGARLVVSDIHPGSQYLGGVAGVTTPDGRRHNMPAHRHLPSAYIRAATDAGLTVLRCEEPPWPPSPTQGGPLARAYCPQAADDAYAAVPAAIIWEFTAARRTATP